MTVELTRSAEGDIFTRAALEFVAELHERFATTRDELLRARRDRLARVRAGESLDFLAETAEIRSDPDWKVAPAPADLTDRRVEITGPTETKMAINALNSGANVWLADLEDANTPHWENVLGGQTNLYDAVRRTLKLETEQKSYTLNEGRLATIVMRPRGWHLDERQLRVDGRPAVAALVDFGLYFFHNARELLLRGSGPYFYLPKMQSHLEARLWANVFSYAEQRLSIPAGSVRATVLIETLPAAFEMEEILYELRDYASGLNAGRWDYLFSIIKTFGTDAHLPDRNQVTMTAPCMRAYTELLVATCHRRGAFAMGGMAAFIPSRRDPQINSAALAKVRGDKEREANDGFDGSWVAHPDLVPICREVFDSVLGESPNQLGRLRADVRVSAADLLDIAATPGEVTHEGVRSNVAVGLRYLESWLRGNGAAAVFNLMEDTATAEIARSQIWQQIHAGVDTSEGEPITVELVRRLLDQELAALREELGTQAYQAGRWDQARQLFERVALSEEFVEFLTIPGAEYLD